MKRFFASLLFFCASFFALPSASAVTMAWSPVGNAGNAPDTTVMTTDGTSGYGSVPYNYKIGTYDVTNSQYVEFLNLKDPTGANALGIYSPRMTFNPDRPEYSGGINYNPLDADGSKYSVILDRGNHPVNYVTWYDTLRFANWLNNGQDNGDTETGAYTLLGGTSTPSNADTVTRNPGATVFLPSEDEWYKAAYFDPRTTAQGGPPADSHYWLYATSSNSPPIPIGPIGAPLNSANYNLAVNNVTDAGAYTLSASPYGTFDQAGNVYEWNEALVRIDSQGHPLRGARGGSFTVDLPSLRASYRAQGVDLAGANDDPSMGFRVASVPEPSTLVLATLSLIGLAAWGWRRKR